jgi:hypothetical protein
MSSTGTESDERGPHIICPQYSLAIDFKRTLHHEDGKRREPWVDAPADEPPALPVKDLASRMGIVLPQDIPNW